jgi:hypothetical protein
MDKLLSDKIEFSKFEARFPSGNLFFTDRLIEILEKAYLNKTTNDLELVLAAAQRDGLTIQYTDILCKLLLADWHECHEDILMMLEDIQDPRSVDTIEKALGATYNYYVGNDIIRKSVWALTKIKSEKADLILQRLTLSADEFTKEHATINLNAKKTKLGL